MISPVVVDTNSPVAEGAVGVGTESGGRPDGAPSSKELTALSSTVRRLEKSAAAATAACASTKMRMANMELQWQLASVSLSGLSALQDVLPFDWFALGRALAACVRSRLLERLRVCPPRRVVSKGSSRNPGMLVFEVDGTRRAMEQLVHEKNLVCSTTSHSRSAVTTRTVSLSGLSGLAHACSMSPSVVHAAKCRSFEHKNRQVITRVLLEQYRHIDGRAFFVCGRHPERREVDVAVRATERWDDRNKKYESPLVHNTMGSSELPGLATSFPGSLSWRESRSSGVDGGADLGGAPGKPLVTFPFSVVRGVCPGVVALLT